MNSTRLAEGGYLPEIFRLQHELVKLQDWVQHTGLKVVVLFEGRDSAGKGGVIKRIMRKLSVPGIRFVATTWRSGAGPGVSVRE